MFLKAQKSDLAKALFQHFCKNKKCLGSDAAKLNTASLTTPEPDERFPSAPLHSHCLENKGRTLPTPV